MSGFMRQILRVDLSTGTIKVEPLPEKEPRLFLGGSGLATWYLLKEVPPGIDPLGPENKLIYMTGLLTGPLSPSSGRFSAVAKSPLTGLWGSANSGGRFGLDLKKSGFDGVNLILTAAEDFSADQSELSLNPRDLQLRELIDRSAPRPPKVDINPKEDLALLVFTGGATGRPKGVMLTHHNLTANTLQSLPWAMGPLEKGIIGKSSLLIGIPAFHSYGHWAIRASVSWGLQMIMIPDPRDIGGIAAQLKKNRPFMAPLVPTQYMGFLDQNIGRTNTSFTSGVAPLPPEVVARFRKITGIPITEAYGLTETSPVTHFNLSSFAKITGFMPFEKKGSFGVPVVDTEVRLVDPVVGSEVPLGEVGELYIKGPQVMKGYWPTPGNGLADGWLPTGDLCRMDEDGYFFLVDRTKDMINVSGVGKTKRP